MKTLITRLRGQVSACCRNREGNVAIIFGLAVIPIMGFVGASIDYSRANAVKADLQAALDSTALMVSKTAATLSADELQTSAKSYFAALFTSPEAQNWTIAASYKSDGGSAVTVNGSTYVKTTFVGILGVPKLNVSSSSTVSWGSSKLQVALVLDNTGSMKDDGKIEALKTASHNLLKQLQGAAQTNGDVRVAIVPFSNGVNVGKENKDAAWLDWSYYSTSGGSGYGDSDGGSYGGSSGGSSGGSWGGSSGGSSGGSWDSNNGSYNGGSSSNSCSWSTCWSNSGDWSKSSSNSSKNAWQGCVMDRDQDYDVLNTTPTTSQATKFPALFNPACPEAVMALSYDWTALNNKIDAMKPTGSTNQTIGLAWGWQALSQGVPLSAPIPTSDTQRVIILLTDGLNTENRWTTDTSKIDARTAKACANIKAAGVVLYTVQVKGSGDPTSSTLQSCATDSKKFFALTSATQMVTTFNTIGTNIAQLRISK